MIDEISLENVALIREASMAPSRGLTVVTGESGSGKTAFLSGIKLLVGERGSADMVREGASSLEVAGRFFPLRPVSASDEGANGDDDSEDIVVQRAIAADGRSRVRLNGRMATVGELAEVVGASIDLCGQHEHQQMMRQASQLKMLDSWIGAPVQDALVPYRAALDEVAACEARRRELQELSRADSARLDEARFALRRIDEVDPQPGEYDELLAEVRRLENIEDLARSAGGAREALSGEGGALDSLNQAISLLNAASALDVRLSNPARALSEACFIVEDAAREVDALVPDAESFDAVRLEELQNRLAAFQGLMRSFGPTMEEVLAHREAAARTVSAVDDLDEQLALCDRELEAAEAVLADAAGHLSRTRQEHAPRFSREVNSVLAQLEMPGAEISCTFERLDRARWGVSGPDAMSFAFKPGAAFGPRPLNRIASGGELSRVTLAVKAVMGSADAVETLVFDEVDAGVGGKAARAVGEVLRRLASTHQVIVVTHLAQIAALGDAHYVVERSDDEVPQTRLREVSGFERAQEVARMLSGAVDNTSLVHAEAMLRSARRS